MNPFRTLFDALSYVSSELRRLGAAVGSLADQVEQRAAVEARPGPRELPANGVVADGGDDAGKPAEEAAVPSNGRQRKTARA